MPAVFSRHVSQIIEKILGDYPTEKVWVRHSFDWELMNRQLYKDRQLTSRFYPAPTFSEGLRIVTALERKEAWNNDDGLDLPRSYYVIIRMATLYSGASSDGAGTMVAEIYLKNCIKNFKNL